MLDDKKISMLTTAAEWAGHDITDIEEMLFTAGKGKDGNYEHYFLTMGIYHLREAIDYFKQVINSHPEVKKPGLISRNTADSKIVPWAIQKNAPAKTESRSNAYEEIVSISESVLDSFPEHVAQVKRGELGPFGFLVGQVVSKNPSLNTATVAEYLRSSIEDEELVAAG